MTISYSENNRRENIFEPLLNRQRLAYKGPVSSASLNLASDQFFMDVKRLDQKTELLQDLINQASQMSRNDMDSATPDYYLNEELLMTFYTRYIEYNEATQGYVIESATPNYNDTVSFNKSQINSALITQMHRKLDIIEDAMRKDN